MPEKVMVTYSLQRKTSTSQYENETAFISVGQEFEPSNLQDGLLILDQIRGEVRKRVDEETLLAPKKKAKTPIQPTQPAAPPQGTTPFDGVPAISDAQAKRLVAEGYNQGWIYDPGDGTKNFSAFNSMFSQKYGITRTNQLPAEKMQDALKTLEKGPQAFFGSQGGGDAPF